MSVSGMLFCEGFSTVGTSFFRENILYGVHIYCGLILNILMGVFSAIFATVIEIKTEYD